MRQQILSIDTQKGVYNGEVNFVKGKGHYFNHGLNIINDFTFNLNIHPIWSSTSQPNIIAWTVGGELFFF
jgi:hypothetical protein